MKNTVYYLKCIFFVREVWEGSIDVDTTFLYVAAGVDIRRLESTYLALFLMAFKGSQMFSIKEKISFEEIIIILDSLAHEYELRVGGVTLSCYLLCGTSKYCGNYLEKNSGSIYSISNCFYFYRL